VLEPLKYQLEVLLRDATDSIKEAPQLIADCKLNNIAGARAIKDIGANVNKLAMCPIILTELLS
jgi:hypothetical protein